MNFLKTFNLSLVLFFLLNFLSASHAPAGFSDAPPSELTVDDLFKNKTPGGFPAGWKTYPFQMGKAKRVYQTGRENGGFFIRARDDQDISMPIFKDFSWSLQQHPYLNWQWRAQELPPGAREDSRATNDSACSVYVAFGKTSGVALKYVWSTTLPVGHVWEKEPGKFYIVVKTSGTSKLKKWNDEKVNVVADFKKYFGKDPSRNPSGIGLMTDGNATHSLSACDYRDLTISKN